MKFDILLKNGRIIDGSGKPSYIADLAISKGRIVGIEPSIPEENADEVINVEGLCVAPGFIDIHSHSDLTFFMNDSGAAKLYQGVTSELSGQCGSTAYPCLPEHKNWMDKYGMTPRGIMTACSLEEFCRGVEKRHDRMGTNQLPLIGHGALRCGVMHYDNRDPEPCEMEAMENLLRRDMEYGAWGLSLGLGYTPGLSSHQEELSRLGAVVAPFGGIVTSHMRQQGYDTPKSLEEMYNINRFSGVHVHIAHFKASGKAAWGRSQEFVDNYHAAQKSGINVTADVYPYTASSSGITNSFPKWTIQGGTHHAVEILQGPEREKLMSFLREKYSDEESCSALLVADTRGLHPDADGCTIWEISKMWNMDPADVVAKLCIDSDARTSCISFGMSDSDVEVFLRQDDICIGSDGRAFPLDPKLNNGKPHPRNFGTFPRFLKMAREKKFCSPEIAIRRITGQSADYIGITDRGYLKTGLVADITVLDMDKVADTATYKDPFQKPVGIIHVIMDGRFAVRNGEQTEERLGKILLRD